ncbi:hypothetical protein CISG_09544 [Coccidioides immitis RMSCC 3703]|uniref:Uncharacterized protein n=1 Tax=Coccidioides immitis RMSCC 3703 TaxID=454286 RepID=A0A0J8QMN0_COCIT|nr:hypothetical protein CISG_09544 [Coccidioides immitis RMSCC 3703]
MSENDACQPSHRARSGAISRRDGEIVRVDSSELDVQEPKFAGFRRVRIISLLLNPSTANKRSQDVKPGREAATSPLRGRPLCFSEEEGTLRPRSLSAHGHQNQEQTLDAEDHDGRRGLDCDIPGFRMVSPVSQHLRLHDAKYEPAITRRREEVQWTLIDSWIR